MVILISNHGFMTVLHLPRPCSAFGNDVDDLVLIESGLLSKVQAFRQALYQACNADLVHHLGELTTAGSAHERDGTCVMIQERGDGIKMRLLAAAHNR